MHEETGKQPIIQRAVIYSGWLSQGDTAIIYATPLDKLLSCRVRLEVFMKESSFLTRIPV